MDFSFNKIYRFFDSLDKKDYQKFLQKEEDLKKHGFEIDSTYINFSNQYKVYTNKYGQKLVIVLFK